MPPHYQLRIKSLKFISAVDRGAQGPIANAALIKRAPVGESVEAMCKVAGIDEKMGLVFGWACVSTVDGGVSPHIDLQKDAIIGGDDLIKVAAEFMEAAASSDVMHDCNPDGKIVFAMPLTADVKTALKIHSDVEGLAIAMKPSPETFKRFVSKELNAFSIYGEGERILVKSEPPAAAAITPIDPTAAPTPGVVGIAEAAHEAAKRKAAAIPPPQQLDTGDLLIKALGSPEGERLVRAVLSKAGKKKKRPPAMAETYKRVGRIVLTSIEDGHQHQINLDDPACCYYQLSTSYQTAEGAEDGHCHAWIYDGVTGAITIAMDSGHKHTVTDVVPADVIAAAKEEDEPVPQSPCAPPCTEEKPAGSTVVVAVSARAPAAPSGDSTPPIVPPTVVNKEQGMPTAEETITKQATDLANLRKMLAASLALTEPQRLHVAKLAPTSVEEFLSLDNAGRESALAAALAADPEVHKCLDGTVIRKSDGATVLMLAKQADASALVIKAQAEEIAKAKAAGEQATFEKRATAEIGRIAKVDVGSAILKALETIPDEAVRKAATEALKGANFGLSKIGVPIGAVDDHGPNQTGDDPVAKLKKMADELAVKKSITFAKAYNEVLDTAEGQALYGQITTPALRAV